MERKAGGRDRGKRVRTHSLSQDQPDNLIQSKEVRLK